MKRIALALLLLAGCDTAEESPEVAKAPEPDSPCVRVVFEETPLVDCIADPARHAIRTVLSGSRGNPYRGFAEYTLDRAADADPVAFAVNGGMFDNLGKPIGYYVEDGKRLKELNRARGLGNFHLLPNGVFYVDGKDWRIRTADDFYENVTDRPDYGTQSGPMLVIDGELHPDIQDDGPSRYVRNAVGIDDEGRAHFVISGRPLSFGRLARYYRDELEVKNALYLDGAVSSLWDPARDRMDQRAPLGPLIVVEKRATPDAAAATAPAATDAP